MKTGSMYNNKSRVRVGIIGAGASGCICAYWLKKSGVDVTLFDKSSPLRTLLPTGGGRCNLAHAVFDTKELATNYPRGEKFLYSVFSKFSTYDTLEMFKAIGIEIYVQDDNRIFPQSNSAKDVRDSILKHINNIIIENVKTIKRTDNGYVLQTNKATYFFDEVVIATGGHSGYELVTSLGINIIKPKPSLVGLNTKENFEELSGTVVKSVSCLDIQGDLLFTHYGISGPCIYQISSIKAFDKFPYSLSIDLLPTDFNLQEILNKNPHKEIKNILKDFLPQKVIKFILKDIDYEIKAHKINGKMRDLILNNIHKFEVLAVGTNKGEETVTAGGIDLKEINAKTMEVKKYPNLYCIGEILNIDGFCGGFNLQNAWSTAYVAAEAILSHK